MKSVLENNPEIYFVPPKRSSEWGQWEFKHGAYYDTTTGTGIELMIADSPGAPFGGHDLAEARPDKRPLSGRGRTDERYVLEFDRARATVR